MLKWFNSYFSVSRREFNGMFVFVIIMILVFLAPYIYEKLTFEPITVKIETLNANFDTVKTKQYNSTNYNNNQISKYKHSEGILFKFNPNSLTLAGWVKLGLSPKQAASILKYLDKGGKFYNKEDVKKMYAISPANYLKFEPYINIPQQNNVEKFKPSLYNQTQNLANNKSAQKVVVEINSADSATLTTISGVGPAFASRILKYKNRIGGFVSLEQLKEVYGIDSIKYQQITGQIKVNSSFIKTTNINLAQFEELKKVPYLSFKQMNAIIAFRNQHGNFTSINDLQKIVILNPTLIAKIAPYVQFK